VEMAGRRIFLSGSATRWLFHPNVVGSSTMVTDQTGAVVQDTTYYPWGQLWQSPGSFGGNWNFAAFGVLEPTTNLYPTPFRRYSSTQGRWLSPDPLAGSGMNPQSLNRYAYVANSPTNFVDPLGLVKNCRMGWVCDKLNNGTLGGGGACDPSDPFCSISGESAFPDDGPIIIECASGGCPGDPWPWIIDLGFGVGIAGAWAASQGQPASPTNSSPRTVCSARVQNALQNQLDGNGNVNRVVSSNLSGGHFDIQFNVAFSSEQFAKPYATAANSSSSFLGITINRGIRSGTVPGLHVTGAAVDPNGGWDVWAHLDWFNPSGLFYLETPLHIIFDVLLGQYLGSWGIPLGC